MAVNANDMRKGMAIRYKGDIYIVLETQHRTPGNLRAFVQASLRSMTTGRTSDERFSSTEKVETVHVSHEKWEYNYSDPSGYVFMNPATYDTLAFQEDLVKEIKDYLVENLACDITFIEGRVALVEAPPTVTLKVTSSPEGVRGDSASNVQKPATLETGLEVQVPLFIKEGEEIKIDTRTGKYLGRAKE